MDGSEYTGRERGTVEQEGRRERMGQKGSSSKKDYIRR